MTITIPNDISQQEKIIRSFDTVAADYNHPSLRFFPFTADRLVSILNPKPGQKVLDVASGTGVVAIAMAQSVLPGGRVLAIDLSEGMLAQARTSITKMALNNIDTFTMDGEKLIFKSNYFDHVVCSFGLFFMTDMAKAIAAWRRVTKPGGTIIFTSFEISAYQPMIGQFFDDLVEFGAVIDQPPLASERLRKKEDCMGILNSANLIEPQVKQIQVGYYLLHVDEWWDVIWNSAIRNILYYLPESKWNEFKKFHLANIEQFVAENGLWLDVPVLVSQGKVQ